MVAGLVVGCVWSLWLVRHLQMGNAKRGCGNPYMMALPFYLGYDLAMIWYSCYPTWYHAFSFGFSGERMVLDTQLW